MENTIIGSGPASIIGSGSGTTPTLRRATQEFESILIAQRMQTMRATVPDDGLIGSDSGQGMFRDMLDQEFCRQIAFAGGFGIGDLLYQQLKGK